MVAIKLLIWACRSVAVVAPAIIGVIAKVNATATPTKPVANFTAFDFVKFFIYMFLIMK